MQRRRIVDFERNPNLKGLELLNALYDLIASRKTVTVNYRSFKSRKTRPFTIYPYLLKEYRNRWFLIGSKVEDMEIMTLALDRIVDFQECNDVIYKENPEFGEDYFEDIVGVTKHSGLKKDKVVIWADNSQASYILTKPIHSSQRLMEKRHEDGSMTFELDVVINPELVSQLMTFGAGIKVISPASLVKRLREIYRAGVKNYEN